MASNAPAAAAGGTRLERLLALIESEYRLLGAGTVFSCVRRKRALRTKPFCFPLTPHSIVNAPTQPLTSPLSPVLFPSTLSSPRLFCSLPPNSPLKKQPDGSSPAVRHAAADQVAAVAVSHPANAPALLRRLGGALRSRDWDARAAAARCVGIIAEGTRHATVEEVAEMEREQQQRKQQGGGGKQDASAVDAATAAAAPAPAENNDLLSLSGFDAARVLSGGRHLLASGGTEFDAPPFEAGVPPRERAARQRAALAQRLGLDAAGGRVFDAGELIKDEDLAADHEEDAAATAAHRKKMREEEEKQQQQQNAASLAEELVGLSARERAQRKRALKRGGAAASGVAAGAASSSLQSQASLGGGGGGGKRAKKGDEGGGGNASAAPPVAGTAEGTSRKTSSPTPSTWSPHGAMVRERIQEVTSCFDT